MVLSHLCFFLTFIKYNDIYNFFLREAIINPVKNIQMMPTF